MGRVSKALAGGFAAAVVTVAMPLILALTPDAVAEAEGWATAVEYVLYTLLVGGAVWAAPANTN